MRLSIVIPAYNEETLIGACIEAVKRSADATHITPEDYEIIVVNNASTDHTREIASSFGYVRVVDEPHKGLTRAKQAGYRASSGDIIAHPDADTLMPKAWLSTVLSAFERDRELLAVTGPYVYYDLGAFKRLVATVFIFCGYLLHLFYQYFLGTGATIQGGNYAVRRSALNAIGGYDTSIEFYGEDTDLAKRISKIGKVRWTWSLVMYTSGRRFAAESMVTTGARYALNYFNVLFFAKPLTTEYTDIRPETGRSESAEK